MDNGASNYRRFLDGDDLGMAQIVKEYKDCLTLYLNGYVGNIFIAEDLMEETFFKIILCKPRFSGKSTFKTWLYTIGRNVAIDYIRKNKNVCISTEDYESLLIEQESVERTYLIKEDKVSLYRAIDGLKPEYKQVLFLIYFEDFTNSQAAVVMKKSKHQIENLIYRAKTALKTKLEKEGFSYEKL